MPPELKLDLLNCRALIDYVTVWYSEKRPDVLPVLDGRPKWHKKKGETVWELTVHDPSPKDIRLLSKVLRNPRLGKLELSLDFRPKMPVGDEEREALLLDTFVAIAARFRPEDMAPWGYGLRGTVSAPGQKPRPFHQRLPEPGEQLLYGGKGDDMQAKAYLKRVDQGTSLPVVEHRVRLELTMRRWALMDHFKLDRIDDLFGYPYRSTFSKHFRIVAGPRLRLHRKLGEDERRDREKKMKRAWKTAGVSKFAVAPELPPDTLVTAVKQIRSRARKQLPLEHYVLLRDQAANAKIGDAFKNLERRMR